MEADLRRTCSEERRGPVWHGLEHEHDHSISEIRLLLGGFAVRFVSLPVGLLARFGAVVHALAAHALEARVGIPAHAHVQVLAEAHTVCQKQSSAAAGNNNEGFAQAEAC